MSTGAAASVLHAGEIALQQRTGVHERLAPRALQMLRDQMPDQHRELFEKLPTLLVGSVGVEGRPWASMLVGAPGFVRSPDNRHLVVHAKALPGDSLRLSLQPGQPLGLLGLEPHTRRRNRMNGTLVAVSDGAFTVQVDQSFGNCPQYIQAREPRWVAEEAAALPLESGPVLGSAALELVRAADTCFIASAADQPRGHGGAQGVDVSHRGGRPGFVHVDEVGGRHVLTLPDFRGNFLFNTLGNITVNPRAGLLFVDPERGDVLQLSGSAHILWEGQRLASFAGAQRLLQITIERSRWWPAALPLRWSVPEPAPQLAATGTWAD